MLEETEEPLTLVEEDEFLKFKRGYKGPELKFIEDPKISERQAKIEEMAKFGGLSPKSDYFPEVLISGENNNLYSVFDLLYGTIQKCRELIDTKESKRNRMK